MNFDQAWTDTEQHFIVTPELRVTIQRRAVNIFTFVEELRRELDADFGKRWKIRRDTILAHGPDAIEVADARAEALWMQLRAGL